MRPATHGRSGWGRDFWPGVTKTGQEARQGEGNGRMIWVLAGSVTLIVVAFGVLLVATALYARHQ